jgi:hypothetical protein
VSSSQYDVVPQMFIRSPNVRTYGPENLQSVMQKDFCNSIGTFETRRRTLKRSADDAVDGSSTGTGVPRMGLLLRPPQYRGANHANNYDNRSTRLILKLFGPPHEETTSPPMRSLKLAGRLGRICSRSHSSAKISTHPPTRFTRTSPFAGVGRLNACACSTRRGVLLIHSHDAAVSI